MRVWRTWTTVTLTNLTERAINIHEGEVIGHDVLTDLNHDVLQEECFVPVAQDLDGLVPSP